MSNSIFLGDQIDVSKQFYIIGDAYYFIDRMTDFDSDEMTGILHFSRFERKGRYSFVATSALFTEACSWNFPAVYPEEPSFKVKFSFHGPATFRIRSAFDNNKMMPESSLMIINNDEYSIEAKEENGNIQLISPEMRVVISRKPFSVSLYNHKGEYLTKTMNCSDSACLHNDKVLPLSYVHRLADRKKYSAISLQVSPDEHFYGGGESFTKLDKTGQKLIMFTKDPHGCQVNEMYKPIPFYMSSRGYGVFAHTSAPLTFDLGHTYQETQTIFSGDSGIDLFFFVGSPKEMLTAYTNLTGKSEMPPLWSFGLWMSRISYRSEEEVRDVANKLREYKIPCDVIHIDTGWFEDEWNCDFKFSASRFPDPKKMIADLKENGYRISLWNLPYFTPSNKFYQELIEKGLGITDGDGNQPAEDLVLDFSNQKTIEWYQNKLKGLFDLGVSAIKADFGEAAPVNGIYKSGKSGFTEHNLYPLRYNQVVSEITKEATGDSIIWARSAWAGSQRYPIHWGGDTENTNMGMQSVLRGGLSLGLSGFSFWSNDLGGFVKTSPEELYGRWAFMGIFTSHLRCHGQPPKEPWEYSGEFLELFRKQMDFRYRLTPYVITQGLKSCKLGHPMMRAMFFEFPDDPACFELESQYMFGEDILVAPFFEDKENRDVYLPKGKWVDLWTGEVYECGWHKLPPNSLRGIALARYGAVIPMVESSLTTKEIDWSTLIYYWYSEGECLLGTSINWDEKATSSLTMEKLREVGFIKTICP